MRRLLPHLVVTSVTLMLSSLLLFSFYSGSASRLMADKTADVLDASVTLFSRLQMASLPTFLGLTDEPDVKAFLRSPGLGKVGVYKALNRIDQVASSFDFLDSVYLFSPANGVLSTRSGWERLTGESDPGLAAAIDESARGPSYSYVNRVASFSHERPVPVWSLVVPLPNAGGAGAAAVLNISSQKVRRQVETSRDASDSLVILSAQGSVLTSPRLGEVGREFADAYGLSSAAVLEQARGTQLVERGDKRQMLSWVTLPELGWKFLVLTDEEQFLAPVRDIRNLAVLLGFALIAVSVALMLWISLRQERALRRNEVILAFLSGTLESRDVLKATRALKAEGPWTAMVLRIDGARLLTDSDRRRAHDEVRTVVTRNFDRKAVVLTVREGGVVVFVDAKNNPPHQTLETWNTAALALERGVSVQVFPESVTFSGLAAAFARIEPSLGRFFLLPYGSRVVAAPTAGDPTAPLFLDGELDIFEGALRHGDERMLGELFDRFRARLAARVGDSTFPFWFQSLAYRAELVFGPSFEMTVGKSQSWFQAEVDRVETYDQARELFEGLARTAKARPVNATVKHLEVVRRVKELVARHLNDRGFGTARLADETGFSVPYLREIFKHTEGQSLMAYISHSKLEEAKRLLSQTRLPISAICDRTGFLNSSYFFTYFRKIEGVTPTDYRLRTHAAPTGDLS